MAALNLRPYQEEAATFLFERDRAMVLAPVGAGKTLITLTAMSEMGIKWLVFAPLRVATSVWPVEAAKWAPGLRVRAAVGTPKQRQEAFEDPDADIVVTNYDSAHSLPDLSGFGGVVFDELTRLKNPSGKRFKAIEKAVTNIPIRWGLTGSFTSNGLEDVFGQVKIISEKLLGRRVGVFRQQYFTSILKGAYVEYEPVPGALQHVMARIKHATYLLEPGVYKDKLPPLHTVEVPVEMDLTEYDTMRKDFVLQFGTEQLVAENAAVVTQKLAQLASGFVYGEAGDAHWRSNHKIDAVMDIINENQHTPTIIWYQFVAERDLLVETFPQAVDVKTDGAIDAWNAGRVQILLAHPASAGHGLNLQHGGNHMIWMTLPWSLELYEQAVGRLHRSGQARDVWCYVVQTKSTIDEKIWQALHDKRSLATIALECLK